MKRYIFILSCLFSTQLMAALTESAINFQMETLKTLKTENRISALEFQQKSQRLNYQLNELKSQQFMMQSHQANSAETTPTMQGGTASITGTVQVAAMAVENVQITLYDYNTNGYVGNATTDQFGSYSFANLLAGNYYITATDATDDYINVIWSNTGVEQCAYCQADADNLITLVDAESRLGVDLNLTVGASISGQLLSGAAPVVNKYVQVNSLLNGVWFSNAITDGSGNYQVKGLPDENYYVSVQDSLDEYIDAMWSITGTEQCAYCQPAANNTITLAPAENRMGIDFDLIVGATLSGQMVDQNTLAPVETLSVQLYDPADELFNWPTQVTFDGLGGYTITGIPQGNYVVYLNVDFETNLYIPEVYNNIQCNACYTVLRNGSGDVLNLVNGVVTGNIDFNLEVGASISGFIVDNNDIFQPVTQFGLIYLFNDSNRVLASQLIYGTLYDPMANGSYTVGGLLPGMYFVQGGDVGRQFYQRELYSDIRCPYSGCDRGAGGDPVVLGAGEQRLGVNFLLDQGGKISGTVTDFNTGLPITSDINVWIQFYDATGTVAGGAYVNPNNGTYTSARALPPGTYSVRTGSMFSGELASPYVMEKYVPGGNMDCPGVTCDLTAGNVTVTAYDPLIPNPEDAATVTGIDFALSEGFSFSGTITELGAPDPIADVHVLVYDDNGNFATWATTDVNGDFTVTGLPAGTYYALTNNGSNLPFMGFSNTEAGGWIDILFDGTPCPGSTCDVTTGDPIVLGGAPFTAGSQSVNGVTYDFGLNSGATISGQVRNDNNQLPASGVDINVYNSNGEFYGSYETDADGYYLTVGFPDGTYYLTTSNNGALLDAMYGGGYCIDGNCNPLDATAITVTEAQPEANADFNLKSDYIFKSGLE